jgi:hypothetical protein
MRERTPLITLLTMAASGLVLAGCVDGSATTSPSAGATSAPGSAAPGAPVASCVTGNWRTTAVSAQAASGATSADVSGGGGVALTVGDDGQTAIDFSKMQPVAFTATATGTEVSGRFTFGGKVAGTVRTGAAAASGTSEGPSSSPAASVGGSPSIDLRPSASVGASPSGGATASASGETASGSWEPVPPIDWGDTRVTVDLVQPMKVRVLDNAQLKDYVGEGASRTGDVIDIEPLLGKSNYQCSADSLVLTPTDGGMSWTLSRA